MYLLIFVKSSIIKNVTNLEFFSVKTGLVGTVGNKGAVIMAFNLFNSKLLFINAHLSISK